MGSAFFSDSGSRHPAAPRVRLAKDVTFASRSPPSAAGTSMCLNKTALHSRLKRKKRRGLLRGAFRIVELELEPNYFDCDFLNMRSIFSFVASQQAWLA